MLEFLMPYLQPVIIWLTTAISYSLTPSTFSHDYFINDSSTQIKQSRSFVIAGLGSAAVLGALTLYCLPIAVRDSAGGSTTTKLSDAMAVLLVLLTGFLVLPAAWPFAPRKFIWKEAMALYAFAFGIYSVANAIVLALGTAFFDFTISLSDSFRACAAAPPILIGSDPADASWCWTKAMGDLLIRPGGGILPALKYDLDLVIIAPIIITIASTVLLGRVLGARLAFSRYKVVGISVAMLIWIWTLQISVLAFSNWPSFQTVTSIFLNTKIPDLRNMEDRVRLSFGIPRKGYFIEQLHDNQQDYCETAPLLLNLEDSIINMKVELSRVRAAFRDKNPHMFDNGFRCPDEDRWIPKKDLVPTGASSEDDRYNGLPPIPE